eukprot:TRINITY_DN8753_c0_g1_i1.p1 TRINITY_DN8753_c0_g1~~TRINITY_DN8753_c0_g1_i1.p1  ORF type:complete len:243 (+),score=37.42 TRINITY_DN8753_c0_g1_i1:106-834(+)
MPRLTAELIWNSPTFINPLKERELDLRGNKIPLIENLGATQDHYDVIDLSDNELSKLENFPLLTRLHTLFFNNNKISKIIEGIEKALPSLETLVLTNNRLQELRDIDNLSGLKNLKLLSLLNNPITTRPHYRLYVIYKIPSLRVLDFTKIRLKEREAANQLFGGEEGKKLKDEISAAKNISITSEVSGLSEDMRRKIVDAIKVCKSKQELSELEHALTTGKLPKWFMVIDTQNTANNDNQKR